jgi:hypothetical protein
VLNRFVNGFLNNGIAEQLKEALKSKEEEFLLNNQIVLA